MLALSPTPGWQWYFQSCCFLPRFQIGFLGLEKVVLFLVSSASIRIKQSTKIKKTLLSKHLKSKQKDKQLSNISGWTKWDLDILKSIGCRTILWVMWAFVCVWNIYSVLIFSRKGFVRVEAQLCISCAFVHFTFKSLSLNKPTKFERKQRQKTLE